MWLMACSGASSPSATDDSDEMCPGGMGESACCEGGTSLCGSSFIGELCCSVESETCATCWDGSDGEVAVCLAPGEDCATGPSD